MLGPEAWPLRGWIFKWGDADVLKIDSRRGA